MLDEVETGKQELIDIFMEYQNKDDEEAYKTWLHLFPLISAIINYSEEVEHLDLLVDSFYTYHKPEAELKIDDKKKTKSSRRLAINWLVDLSPPYVRFRIRRFNL